MVKGIWIGLVGTVAWLAFIVLFRFHSLHTLKAMPLHEFVGFLAGVVGPVALFWLVLGYWFQARELNTRVNRLQAQVDHLAQFVEADRQTIMLNPQTPDQNRDPRQLAARPLWLVSSFAPTEAVSQGRVHNIQISNAGGTVSDVRASIGGAGLNDWVRTHPTAFDRDTEWNVEFTLSDNFDVQFGRLTLACRLANGAALEINVPFSKPKGTAELEWFIDESYPT